MANIIINDGLEKVTINGDENRAFYFNPTDFSLPQRLMDALGEIKKECDQACKGEETATDKSLFMLQAFEKMNISIRNKIDEVFNASVSDAIFGKVSALSIIGDKMYFELVFEALIPIVENRIAEAKEAMSRHTAKYVNKE